MNDKELKLNSSEKISRRNFAKAAVIGVAASAQLINATAQTSTPTPPKELAAPPNPQTSPTPQAVSPIAVAYGAVAEARFGKFLNADELAKVKEDMIGNVRTSERLSAAKLQNADEPDFVFSA